MHFVLVVEAIRVEQAVNDAYEVDEDLVEDEGVRDVIAVHLSFVFAILEVAALGMSQTLGYNAKKKFKNMTMHLHLAFGVTKW